jgi:protein phosphatase
MNDTQDFPVGGPRFVVASSWHTDVGKRRQTNEDAARCDELINGLGELSTLLTLSDGVGGANAGEVASLMAVDGIFELLNAKWAQGVRSETETPDHWIDQAMRDIDQRIRAAGGTAGTAEMGATLSTAWIIGSRAWWGQAGDSRIYVFRDDSLRQITVDQSPVGRLRADGALTEAEARAHPMRNLIDQCLGGNGEAVIPVTGYVDLIDNDIFLLCSDGLNDGLWDEELAKGLREVAAGADLTTAAYQLVEDAKEASGRDNITAIVARVRREG